MSMDLESKITAPELEAQEFDNYRPSEMKSS